MNDKRGSSQGPGRTGGGIVNRYARHPALPRSSASPEATIEVNGLRKRFGPTVALDGMTFSVPPGRVTGFVGPNGAGKSTTMRVILGLDAADTATAPDVLLIEGLSADRTVAALTAKQVTFAEVTTHRATLEEAYMKLTRDAVEYRAAPAAGGATR